MAAAFEHKMVCRCRLGTFQINMHSHTLSSEKPWRAQPFFLHVKNVLVLRRNCYIFAKYLKRWDLITCTWSNSKPCTQAGERRERKYRVSLKSWRPFYPTAGRMGDHHWPWSRVCLYSQSVDFTTLPLKKVSKLASSMRILIVVSPNWTAKLGFFKFVLPHLLNSALINAIWNIF